MQKLFIGTYSEVSGQISYTAQFQLEQHCVVSTGTRYKIQYNEINEILNASGHLQNCYTEQTGLLITDQGSYPVYESSRC